MFQAEKVCPLLKQHHNSRTNKSKILNDSNEAGQRMNCKYPIQRLQELQTMIHASIQRQIDFWWLKLNSGMNIVKFQQDVSRLLYAFLRASETRLHIKSAIARQLYTGIGNYLPEHCCHLGNLKVNGYFSIQAIGLFSFLHEVVTFVLPLLSSLSSLSSFGNFIPLSFFYRLPFFHPVSTPVHASSP